MGEGDNSWKNLIAGEVFQEEGLLDCVGAVHVNSVAYVDGLWQINCGEEGIGPHERVAWIGRPDPGPSGIVVNLNLVEEDWRWEDDTIVPGFTRHGAHGPFFGEAKDCWRWTPS